MDMGRVVERVRRLSDGELLAGLSGVLGGSRRLVALLLAHLAEVEERRLHLLAGYGSLFVYCTGGLGMSEDEAYRRIRVARLARRFSGVLELLAAGQVSLSVAALVEPQVTGANHVALLAAVSGKTVQQAREVLAAWYPKPDVLPFVRKLPERSSAVVGPLARRSGAVSGSARCDGNSDAGASSSALGGTLTDVGAPALPGGGERVLPAHAIDQVSTDESSRMTAASAVEHAAAGRAQVALGALGATRARQSSSIVEPLSPGRYRVQFTADAELKRQIDLARDLLRHAVPQGDLATLVGRALDLLIETTLRRRFGKGSGNGEASKAVASARTAGAVAGDVHSSDRGSEREVLVNTSEICAAPKEPASSRPGPKPGERAQADSESVVSASGVKASRRFPMAARRMVFERDGLRCAWVAPDGTRCNSRAWLEHDHITPHGQGGSNDAANGRLFCQPHNRLAAEQAYGQDTIARIIDHRRAAPSVDVARPSGGDTRAEVGFKAGVARRW